MADQMDLQKTAISTEMLLFFKTPFVKVPTSKPFDFDAMIGGNLSKEARDLLALATTQREKLLEVLGDGNADPRNVIAAVDAYLPSIWTVTASMQASADSKVRLMHKMEFKWTSALSAKDKEHIGSVFLYEAAFALAIRGVAHRDAAKIVWERGENNFQEMGKELRLGAGVFDFIGKDLLARWVDPPEKRAPEMQECVHACLSALFLADAQRVAIAKALDGGSTNPLTIAKLLIGTAEKYEYATRQLQQADKETFDGMIPGLLEELGALPAILRACAANCQAQAAWAKKEYAKGLAFVLEATRRLKIINMGKGLKASNLQTHLTAAMGRNAQLEKEYQNDCNLVFFEKPSKELRWVDGTFIITSIAYELPLAEVVSFAEVPLPADQQKMPIKTFWQSLWAKPVDYPKSKDEHTKTAPKVAGADGEVLEIVPPEEENYASNDVSNAKHESNVPYGMDASVFDALPEDIQKEILAENASVKL